MGELVPFGKFKDQPIERQALTAEPVKILQASNIVELFPDGPPPRDARYSPQFPRVDRPNVIPLLQPRRPVHARRAGARSAGLPIPVEEAGQYFPDQGCGERLHAARLEIDEAAAALQRSL